MERCLVIIPAYNEEASILKTVDDIRNNAPGFDHLVINDCSVDDTERVCRENGIHFLNLPINLGIGGAVQTGYQYALRKGYAYAVQFDGDGQHKAEYLGTMLKRIKEENADMIIGSRFIEKEGFQSSAIRRFGIRYFSVLIKLLTGKRVTDPTSGMRMVGRDVMEIYSESYPKDYPEPESVVAILNKGKHVIEYP
ncbi:MAG TPA: glycosyl transferase family 2, partial [Lachnospiraceae bacterium]|nr:glycosyl transferase family 2 [Lachnospiraceae bacterium]